MVKMKEQQKIMLNEDLIAELDTSKFKAYDGLILDIKNLTEINTKKKLAIGYFEKEEWANAAEISAILVELIPEDCDNLFIFATALAQTGNLKDAIMVANKLLINNPLNNDYKQLREILLEANRGNEENLFNKNTERYSRNNQETKISLVTACMNREEHLQKSLPLWLKLPHVDEIVIVDWNNSNPLIEITNIDDRIKVIRIESEEKWVLSYAYNIGIFNTKNRVILKCDADCIPDEKVLQNLPNKNSFYAGYWKSGAKAGKASVNGQCLFLKEHFELINGYSEYIRTYGRDDEDLYDRLMLIGLNRKEIIPSLLKFIEHGDEMRVKNQFKIADNNIETIYRSTTFNEMYNLYVGKKLPWGAHGSRAKYNIINNQKNSITLQRIKKFELILPENVKTEAELFALRYMVKLKITLPQNEFENLKKLDCINILNK